MNDKEIKILEASITLFSKKGYGATTTASIAEHAGVAKGTLFNYYPNKEYLFNQSLIYVHQDLVDYVSNLKEKKDFKKGMIEVWNRTIDYGLKYSDNFNFLIKYSNSPLLNDEVKEKLNNQGKFFFYVYNKFQTRGEIKEPYYLFCNFMMQDVVATIDYLVNNPNEDIEKIKKVSFDFLWAGVGIEV
ncbi:hypothetical protein BGI41_04510 [Methanobrevibacter sp. 87.7]|uniref:TetR/AcrR family transcriptional regulator n=1 Tax=Methanobrevibacter sp. 87.7 TaxID=387957 RepID=UPI000B50189D|nr:TetR/AcrR family transcriptional regulator [Methanobrevibacter sp. 87.7]OWT33031.1 hypothetical protein BGI41_04510 [Methanobrevibacter sp. 87.7]